jgi:hypothetical protein
MGSNNQRVFASGRWLVDSRMYGKHLSGFRALFVRTKMLFAFLQKCETSRKFVNFHKYSVNCNMAKIRQKICLHIFVFVKIFLKTCQIFLSCKYFHKMSHFVQTLRNISMLIFAVIFTLFVSSIFFTYFIRNKKKDFR